MAPPDEASPRLSRNTAPALCGSLSLAGGRTSSQELTRSQTHQLHPLSPGQGLGHGTQSRKRVWSCFISPMRRRRRRRNNLSANLSACPTARPTAALCPCSTSVSPARECLSQQDSGAGGKQDSLQKQPAGLILARGDILEMRQFIRTGKPINFSSLPTNYNFEEWF